MYIIYFDARTWRNAACIHERERGREIREPTTTCVRIEEKTTIAEDAGECVFLFIFISFFFSFSGIGYIGDAAAAAAARERDKRHKLKLA